MIMRYLGFLCAQLGGFTTFASPPTSLAAIAINFKLVLSQPR